MSHLRLAPIRIEYPHSIIGAINARKSEDDSIRANPEVPITQPHCLLRSNLRLRSIPIINLSLAKTKNQKTNPNFSVAYSISKISIAYQDEVVAEAVILHEVKYSGLSPVQKRSGRRFLGCFDAHGRRRRRSRR